MDPAQLHDSSMDPLTAAAIHHLKTGHVRSQAKAFSRTTQSDHSVIEYGCQRNANVSAQVADAASVSDGSSAIPSTATYVVVTYSPNADAEWARSQIQAGHYPTHHVRWCQLTASDLAAAFQQMHVPSAPSNAKSVFNFDRFQQMRQTANSRSTTDLSQRSSVSINIVTCQTNVFRASSATPTRVEQNTDDFTAAMQMYDFAINAELASDDIELVMRRLVVRILVPYYLVSQG
jgi:hypothetical protein